MKMNLKKILIAGTVLTAFCANAFAAEEAQAPQPTMKEKVAAILHHDDERPCPPDRAMRKPHHKPQLTPAQKAERQKLRENWEKMTPKERQQALEKMHKERQQAHDKYAKETMSKLTDSQKAEVEQFIKDDMAQRQARRDRLEKMTPEQREAVKANKPIPQKPPKGFDKHHKGEFRGNAPHGGPHHPGEMPPAPQDMMD